MNVESKAQLSKMIDANSDAFVDTTDMIRELKHSRLFLRDIAALNKLMDKYPEEPENVAIEAISECSFLCTYYTDLYNRIRKKEIDMKMLFTFLDILTEIEEGHIDQTEGAVKVGEILKKIYVDSALKKADKLNADPNADANADPNNEEEKPKAIEPSRIISYSEYKHRRANIEANFNKVAN